MGSRMGLLLMLLMSSCQISEDAPVDSARPLTGEERSVPDGPLLARGWVGVMEVTGGVATAGVYGLAFARWTMEGGWEPASAECVDLLEFVAPIPFPDGCRGCAFLWAAEMAPVGISAGCGALGLPGSQQAPGTYAFGLQQEVWGWNGLSSAWNSFPAEITQGENGFRWSYLPMDGEHPRFVVGPD